MLEYADPKDHTTTPLHDLSQVLAEDMARVNHTILERIGSDVPLISKVATYLIAAGGKRVRPLLTLAVTKALGGDMQRAHGLSAVVEFIHTATLLHDDVVDESHERRGKMSANDVFGNQTSVLVGDFLFSRAFQLMVADGSLDTLKILSDAAAIIAQGEVLQLQMQGNLETSWEEYLQMISGKTAALFAAACEVGAVISDAPKDVQVCMKEYGYHLGIAFQIADDVLDYTAQSAKIGKNIGDDFKEGKISAPLLLAYQEANTEEQTFWQRTITKKEQHEGDFERVQNLMVAHNIEKRGLEIAHAHAARAKNCLRSLPESHVKELLLRLSDYVVWRKS